MINTVTGKCIDKRCVIMKINVGNIEETNGQVIANEMAKYFASIGQTYASKIPESKTSINEYLSKIPRNKKSLYLVPTNETEIDNIIGKLLNKASSGWDGISNRLLKHIKNGLTTPLSLIFNKSLEEGVFPSKMKPACVAPLHKGGRLFLNTNYRPISLLPVISKILEKLMHKRTYSFVHDTIV